MNTRRIWLFFLLAFAAGLLAGAASTWAFQHSHIRRLMRSEPERQQAMLLRRMTEELGLTPAQETQAQSILRNTREQLAQLRQRYQPEIRKIMADNQQQIEKILTPDQVVRYRHMLETKRPRKNRPAGDKPDREEHPPRHHRPTNTFERP